jgi:hypothetical protein
MLRGSPGPGAAFRLDAAADEYAVTQGVHVPRLSPAALSGVLSRFARWGTVAHRRGCGALILLCSSALHAVDSRSSFP